MSVVSEQLREKALLVHERLCRTYGCPIAFFSNRDPLSLLISSMLSHRTKNADTGRAVRALRARFPDWDAVRDAPTHEVEAAIAAARLARAWRMASARRVASAMGSAFAIPVKVCSHRSASSRAVWAVSSAWAHPEAQTRQVNEYQARGRYRVQPTEAIGRLALPQRLVRQSAAQDQARA